MMRITAYTYEADVHCPECARERFRVGMTVACKHAEDDLLDLDAGDENGVATNAVDSEGNPVHPVFDISEHDFTHCGDCHEELI